MVFSTSQSSSASYPAVASRLVLHSWFMSSEIRTPCHRLWALHAACLFFLAEPKEPSQNHQKPAGELSPVPGSRAVPWFSSFQVMYPDECVAWLSRFFELPLVWPLPKSPLQWKTLTPLPLRWKFSIFYQNKWADKMNLECCGQVILSSQSKC